MAYARKEHIFLPEAEGRRDAFRADLATLAPTTIYKKHLLDAEPCVLTAQGKSGVVRYFSEHWGLARDRFTLVGSSITGFSIKPKRRWELFDLNISDIDVAITDAEFFAGIWTDVQRYIEQNAGWAKSQEFDEYLLQGWIRPDVLPGDMFEEWFDFFRALRTTGVSGDIKVRAAIYPSPFFLQRYQCAGIVDCQRRT